MGAVPDVNQGATFRILEAQRLEVFSTQRWKRRRTERESQRAKADSSIHTDPKIP